MYPVCVCVCVYMGKEVNNHRVVRIVRSFSEDSVCVCVCVCLPVIEAELLWNQTTMEADVDAT